MTRYYKNYEDEKPKIIGEEMHTVTHPIWKESEGGAEYDLGHCSHPSCTFQQKLQGHL